jgi:predicted nucleotidyltransferase
MSAIFYYQGNDQFLRELSETLCDAFGDDLIALVVFGSYARGEAKLTSDCDVYLIARALPTNRLDRLEHIHLPVIARFARAISIIAETKTEFESGFPSLYLDVATDGIVLFDRDDYIRKKLARVRELTRLAGLQRVRLNGDFAWKWQRQPAPRWTLDWEGFHEFVR